MAVCRHEAGWDFVFVKIRGECITLCRCKKCRTFGNSYGIALIDGATEVGLDDLPENFCEHLITVIRQIESYQ